MEGHILLYTAGTLPLTAAKAKESGKGEKLDVALISRLIIDMDYARTTLYNANGPSRVIEFNQPLCLCLYFILF